MLQDRNRFNRLRTLTEVSRALTYTTSIDEVLKLAVERAAELMGADKSLIMLTDADGLLAVRCAFGIDEARLAGLHEPFTESLIRRLQVLLDYPTEECFLSVPLVVQGEVTGLLAAVRPHGEPCTEDDEWLLSALADQAAVALENARLTDAVQAEREEREELKRQAVTQGRTHATLGHELRSPLTAIQSYSSLLLDGLFGPLTDRQRESVARIRMSGYHLLGIVESMLDAARINAGVMELTSRDVRLAPVLAEAVQMLQPRAAEKNQEVHTRGGEELVVRADPTRLRQVLVNLIGNAVTYSPAEAAISVELAAVERAGSPFAAIRVMDSGPGMTPEFLAAIFKPYHRGHTAEPGLGLGLFISRELVRQMGGEIEAQSEPGAGSTFIAFLPLAYA
jgi:phosphoserine phosphatase RsbU/P